MRFIIFFKQHYPFFLDFKRAIFAPRAICTFTFLFALLSGKMLTINEQSASSFAFILLFMVSGSQLIWRFLIPFTFKNKFQKAEWTVAKEMLWLILEIFTAIGLCYFLFFIWAIPEGDYFNRAISHSVQTFMALQVLLIPLSIYIKREQVLQVYLSKAMQLNMILLHKKLRPAALTTPEDNLLFSSNDKQKDLCIKTEDLLFVQVTDNYVEIHYLLGSTIQKAILRNTLKAVQEATSNVSYLLQCHRSYIVNLKKVVSVNGNSRGYLILLDGCSTKIPVSRNKISEFDRTLSNLIDLEN